MSDLNEALELAQKIISRCSNCGWSSHVCPDCKDCNVKSLANALLALHDQTHWIPIGEELPEADQHIEARLTVFASVGRHGVAFTTFDDITHWRKKSASPTDNE